MPFVPLQPPAALDTDGLRKHGEDQFREVARAWTEVEGSIATNTAAIAALQNTRIGAIRVQLFTASGTYTPHANMVYCTIEVVGGGGSGGASAFTGAGQTSGMTGGGGGGYAYTLVSRAAVGASQSVTVGAGGAQQGTPGANGNAGGTSQVGLLCAATGGAGGAYAGVGAAIFINGANGGAGTIGVYGCTGEASTATMAITSPNANGYPGNGGCAAKGFGTGGRGLLNSNGENGQAYGGGGGGGHSGASSAARSGGGGAAGVVVITEYCTT